MKPWLTLALFFWLTAGAWGHDAPSGWPYPADCCSNYDCVPVTCDSITETATGFIQGGLTYRRDQVRASGDRHCHACKTYRTPRCLFILPST